MHHIEFRDYNSHIVEEARRVFPSFIKCEVGSPTDIEIDSVVSPANSFGFMNGGIDQHYIEFFGFKVQEKVWAKVAELQFQELLVGDALSVDTNHKRIPFLIVAPTMRTPRRLPDALNVYLASRAATRYAYDCEWSVCFSGMGTGVGGLEIEAAIHAMARGIQDGLKDHDNFETIRDACIDHDNIIGKKTLAGTMNSMFPKPKT